MKKPKIPEYRLPDPMRQETTGIPQDKEYFLPEQAFDGYDKSVSVQQALGSDRTRRIFEIAELRSTNYVPNVSGWRLTPTGLEITTPSGSFPDGTIPIAAIEDIATAKILGRDTAGDGVIEQLSAAEVKTLLAIVAADVSDFAEVAQDSVGNALGAGLSYDDGTGAISTTLTLAASTYTPTDSAGSNVDAVTPTQAQYMRVGATVTVSGRFAADATAGGAASFEIDLPVASNLGAVEDLAGIAYSSGANETAEIFGVVANDTAKVSWTAVSTASQDWSFTFTYQVI